MKPFIGKASHFNWARKVGLRGPVCVLVRLCRGHYQFYVQPILIHTGVNPDGSGMWGEWIMS